MENKEDAYCWRYREDGCIHFWASMIGKEIDAFWFPATDKIRLEWRLDNGYSSVKCDREYEPGAGGGWQEILAEAFLRHLGMTLS